MKIETAHRRARALTGRKLWFYRLVRRILIPVMHLAFRPSIDGVQHVPARGAAMIVGNHRSFFDSFFQGLAIPREIHWMAKSELFEKRWQAALLTRLGAFPVRRGQSDADALDTARALLAAGELVAIFPEGTRGEWVDPRASPPLVYTPKRGAARLAVEAGAPIIPIAMVGTERGRLRRALWHRNDRVHVVIGAPVPVYADDDPEEVTSSRVWPRVRHAVDALEHRRAAQLGAAGGVAMIAGIVSALIRRRR